MKIDILTIFPKMFDSYFEEGMIRKAREQNLLNIQIHDIRTFSKDKWGKVDDTPFGGGAGMLMTPQPIYDAVQHLKKNNQGPVIYMSPKGKTLTHAKSRSLSKYQEIIIICGRYEGIDQRIIDLCVDQEISIGKYVLTGGELAAMVVIDAVARFVPGVLGDENSHVEETFSPTLNGKKEYPHYTKPRVFQGLEVPEVLLSGNHAKINQWRKNKLT
ncbi:MAG: tRNA (guanosine(37)-N1)-methyltransferase TrmD [Candidatus Altimarinota bacterium]